MLFDLFLEVGGIVTNADRAMAHLNMLIHSASKYLGQEQPPVRCLTLRMLKVSGKPPRLKCKAAETRYMLPCVGVILSVYMKPKCSRGELRKDTVAMMQNIYDELYSWSSIASPARIARFGRCFNALFSDLGKATVRDFPNLNYEPYKFYPKNHLLIHCLEDQVGVMGNPKDHWNYQDESAIGDAATVAESSHPNYLHRSVIEMARL